MAKHMVALTHGETLGGKESPEYLAWKSMRQRCQNPNNPRFDHYGGRGIEVCDSWSDFPCFLSDMGRRPSSSHSLDRIDNDKGYSPDNCRWATSREQMVNRGITRVVEIEGKHVPLADLAKSSGIPANTLRFRILNKWDLQRALTQPVRPKRTKASNQ